MSSERPPCTIYLVRHAESEVNAQLGAPEQYGMGGSPLSERGRQQAADLASRLQEIPIARAYASERLRTQQTAHILTPDQPINISSLLRERPDPAGPEPETDAEAVARLTMILNEIARNHPGESVVAVSHGFVMRTLLVALGFATVDELPGGAVTHTGYVKLIGDDERLSIAEVVGVHKTA